MRIILNPAAEDWVLLSRRPISNQPEVAAKVREILDDVRKNGDQALRRLTSQFDGAEVTSMALDASLIAAAESELSPDLASAIRTAYGNISRFHKAQLGESLIVETMPGITCQRIRKPITRVGLYIPGGTAPLFSTVLMLGIPAQLAGCREIVLCTPPNKSGQAHPAILFAATLCGIKSIFLVGGAQAVAAMAYGTESIPAVHKIFGPGNSYVTTAKQLVMADGLAIDMPAGPSEVLVIADSDADPDFVAADLLSQAEHGPDSQVVLLSNSIELINKTKHAIQHQLSQLPRKDIAAMALENSSAILLDSLESCIAFSNTYAPEHLILNTKNSAALLEDVENAGSVFLGPYTPEAAGDYASGTNHTLPTNGFAKAYSGVSVDSFTRQMTVQQITADGLQLIGPVIESMATAENLEAHRQAVRVRLNKLL